MIKYLILMTTEDTVVDVLRFDTKDYEDLGDMLYSFRKRKEMYEGKYIMREFSEIN